MLAEHLIEIDIDGTVTAIWSDDVGLCDLGRVQVIRASDVEFDNNLQAWCVQFRNGWASSQQFTSRQQALEYEVRCIQDNFGVFSRWAREHVEDI